MGRHAPQPAARLLRPGTLPAGGGRARPGTTRHRPRRTRYARRCLRRRRTPPGDEDRAEPLTMPPLFSTSPRTVIVAIDHPLYSWPVAGLEDRRALLQTVLSAG